MMPTMAPVERPLLFASCVLLSLLPPRYPPADDDEVSVAKGAVRLKVLEFPSEAAVSVSVLVSISV